MKHGDITNDIIGASMAVLNELKPGLDEKLYETHIAQMLGYLNISGLEVTLLLNFREATLTWKRVVGGNRDEEDHGLRG